MYDIIIIGSGPAGLSASVYASREQLKAVVAEKNYAGTGQIAESERVDNYLGLYGENGFEMGQKFREHAVSLGAEFYEGEAVGIFRDGCFYKVRFADGSILETKTIIYAAGASHRKLGIKGEEEFTGKGVSYCAVCDGAFYKNKTVAVIGGGDTALGDAVLLSRIADKVYLIHRREEFRANKTLQNNVKDIHNIELVLNTTVAEILGNNKVNSIKIRQNGTEKAFSADGVFIAIGETPNSALLNGLAELDENGYVIAGEDGITSADGIFAAGDVRTKCLRQVVTAAADGAVCVASAENYLENLSNNN